MKLVDWIWDEFIDFCKGVWADFVQFMHDFLIMCFKLLLDGFAAIVNAIPVPSFLAGHTLNDYLSGIDPAVIYFLSQSGMSEAIAIVGAATAFRLARKLATLGQW